ncbi:MAG: cytochrome c [Anaerolineales bacterium]|jgi:mono/diheme cytochrome c family protein|nr:cytochrome c [Chloroflexota bacterium]MBK6647299.1 cytochrome c [Anaerolineales bacterium]
MKNKPALMALVTALLLSACAKAATPVPTPTLDPIALQGQAVFNARCATCHALVPDTIIIGPSLYGIATTAETRVEGQGAEEYITMSVLRPGDYVVEGFNNVMITNLAKELTSEDLDALIAFLMTLK